MENEQAIALLTEIRDLQRLHVENYKEALENQKLGLEAQRQAASLQRRVLVGVLVLLLLVAAAAVILSLIPGKPR